MANPKPESNVQHFLAKIAGVETSTPFPQTTEEYYLEKIAKGGGGGTDVSLNIEGASVGDIIKIKSVNENGKPTAWEAISNTNPRKTHFEVLLNYTFDDDYIMADAPNFSKYILGSGKKAIWNKDNSGKLLRAKRVWGEITLTQTVTPPEGGSYNHGNLALYACSFAGSYASTPGGWWYGDEVGNFCGTAQLTSQDFFNRSNFPKGLTTWGFYDNELYTGFRSSSENQDWLGSGVNFGVPARIIADNVNINNRMDIYAVMMCMSYSEENLIPKGTRIIIQAEVYDE